MRTRPNRQELDDEERGRGRRGEEHWCCSCFVFLAFLFTVFGSLVIIGSAK